MAAAAGALLAAPLVEKGAKAIVEVAQTPVIGFTEIRTFDKGRKHPVHVEQKRSFEVRAWEIVLGVGAAAFFVAMNSVQSNPPWYVNPNASAADVLRGFGLGFLVPPTTL